ncbi:MAG: T9SS type A sorting domain-containing protein [Bacteroidia bacterium]|nr:T9SS type A sorting domain-containing protein [Bacteroidia bacterium]
MKTKLLVSTALIALGAVFQTAKAQTATLQVIHNCADGAAATVDIYAGTSLLINDLSFRHASPTLTNIPASAVLTIGVAPGTSTSSSQAIATFTVNFAPNSMNIVVADGIVSPTGYSPSNMVAPFTLSTYTMGMTAAPNATTTSVLVHHGSTDAPIVDVVAPFTGTNPVLPNILVNNAGYTAFSSYLNLPTADYKIQVRDQYSENVVAEYDAPLSTLNLGGSALTVLASGFLNPANNSNGPAFGLFVSTVAGGSLIPLPSANISSTRLQAIHNCADLGAAQVDVWFKSAVTGSSDILLIDDFSFRTASPYIDVPAGQTVTLSIAAPNSTSAASALASFTYNLSSSNKYQLVASGLVSSTGYSPSSAMAPFNLSVNAIARERALAANNTDVLVFHGATDAPIVGVTATGNGTLIPSLAYPSFYSGGYLSLPSSTSSGDYTIHVTDAAGTTTVASYLAPLNTLNLSGSAITVLASGFLNPAVNSNGPAFGLWVALPSGGNLVQLPAYTPTITGITDNNFISQSLSVYPNPFSDRLKVLNSSGIELTYELLTIDGKMIRMIKSSDSNVELNTSDLPSGLYFLKTNVGGIVDQRKLIK